MANLSEQLKRLTSTQQNFAASIESLSKHMQSFEVQLKELHQQVQSITAVTGNSNNFSIITSNNCSSTTSTITGNSNNEPTQLNTKLPPLPKCNSSNPTTPIISSSSNTSAGAEAESKTLNFGHFILTFFN